MSMSHILKIDDINKEARRNETPKYYPRKETCSKWDNISNTNKQKGSIKSSK